MNQTARAMNVIRYLLEIINDSKFTVTGETCLKVAQVVTEAQALHSQLEEGELAVLDRAEEAGPPPEEDGDVPF